MNNILPENILIGGKLKNKVVQVDFSISKEEFKGIAYAHNLDDKGLLSKFLEYAVLNITNYIGFENTIINIIDFNFDSKYYNINEFRNVEGLIKFINREQLRNSLLKIEEYIEELNKEYLQGKYKTICDYNKVKTNEPLMYNLIVLNLDYFEVVNDNDYILLSKLLKKGRMFGILFFIQMDALNFAQELNTCINKGPNHNIKRFDFLKTIKSYPAVLYNHNGKYKIQNTSLKISEALSKFRFITDEIEFKLESIVNALQKAISDKAKLEDDQDFISIPIGKKGRTIYDFKMGQKSSNFHGFIGGQTGSGKSNLLNNIIVQIAERYSPDHLRLQLLDLKLDGGTEFFLFKNHPNVEKLVLTSRLDISKHVIKTYLNELMERSKLFKKYEVKNIEEYNKLKKEKLPFKLMIIDEVQNIFNKSRIEDNFFNETLVEFVKQSRAAGMHLLIATQSLTQVNIDSPILEQMKLRIAFKLSGPKESNKIMTYENDIPHTKLKKYEVVYNTENGNPSYNSVFLTNEIKTQSIKERLKKCNHTKELHFEMEVFNNNTILKASDNIENLLRAKIEYLSTMSDEPEVDLDKY